MGWIVWLGAVVVGLLTCWLSVRRPVRRWLEAVHDDHAREQFRLQREWLEARFLGALARVDPAERLRWEDAHWHDEVLWARDRQTRRLLALLGVHFDSAPFDVLPGSKLRSATALFEYRKGRWCAEGKRLDEIGPDEAVRRSQWFVPVAPHHHRRG
jgi:hypothetical protein